MNPDYRIYNGSHHIVDHVAFLCQQIQFALSALQRENITSSTLEKGIQNAFIIWINIQRG